MKDIREYLHYYIGQKHRYRYIDWEPGHWTPWFTLKNESLDPMLDLSIDGLQLALRKLEDMTEEEVRASIKLMEGHVSKYPIHRRVKNAGTADQLSQWYYVHNNEEHIIMNLSGGENGFQIYNNGNHYYRCYMKLFDYLLSKGFDLFGLVDAGLAIDAKTITQ